MNFETFRKIFEEKLNIAFTEDMHSGADIHFSKEEAADGSVYMILDDEGEIASDYCDSIYIDEHSFGSRIEQYLTKVDSEGGAAFLIYIAPCILEEEHLVDWDEILTARGLNIDEDVQDVIALCTERKFSPATKENTFVIIDDTNTEVLHYSVSSDDEEERCVTDEEHAAILDLIAFELAAGKTFAEGMHQDLEFEWELV